MEEDIKSSINFLQHVGLIKEARAIRNLIARHKELECKLEIEKTDNKYNQEERDEETIPRYKVKEKIEELKGKYQNAGKIEDMIDIQIYNSKIDSKIQVLQELLEDDDNDL